MSKLLLKFLLLITLMFYLKEGFAVDIINISPKFCKHGLQQPEKNDFAVFIFCDDASGTQIGIIYTKAGVGPIEFDSNWSNINRFWQEGIWMVDVKQIVWSSSGNFLYLVTSEVYSNGAFYELDLRKRKAIKLLGRGNTKKPINIDKVSSNNIWVNGEAYMIK